jgi:hypothetical protein
MPEYSPQPGDRVLVEGTVTEVGSETVILDCDGGGVGVFPASAARRMTQMTQMPPGGWTNTLTVDQDEVAKTRDLIGAANLHYHQHAGSEFETCTRTECMAALKRGL